MDKVSEARMALFEAWWIREECSEKKAETWEGFNAALDCVEIELPEPHFEFEGDTCGELFDSEVRAAIESTGLGLRIK